ncbi:MAG: phosphoglucosamine mutase [Clostridia bacterium]|nr:phosphoglucosamine mutase [Clostridia bacterium]MBR5742526.1 phosphoglucosamine mutase [Clostridia bacterium]
MGKYFGTDGFRGKAGVDLTSEHAYKIGRYLGYVTAKKNKDGKIVIGKDTRLSSYMYESALIAGIVSSGADAYLMHVTTTPSVSYIAKNEGFDYGIMISASHNPYGDNGIKLLNGDGEKIDDETIAGVEAYLDGEIPEVPFATGRDIGRAIDHAAGRNRYIGYLISLATHSYRGVKVGLDAANGSTWMIAKSIFDALGAETHVIHNTPDGTNINENCGSTHIDSLVELVKRDGLDVGFAFDGDADRLIAVDEKGEVVNGDAVIYLCGKYMKEHGMLRNNTVVTTVMSNFGLYKALDREGIAYEKTAVGDRYVYENMKKNGHMIGGEQSGHVIFTKYASTGDGILTSLMVMQVMLDKKLPLSKLHEDLVAYPQVLKNVRVRDKDETLASPKVQNAVKEAENALGDDGRVLLRKSGTEPVLRVMAEAGSPEECEKWVDHIIDAMKEEGYVL